MHASPLQSCKHFLRLYVCARREQINDTVFLCAHPPTRKGYQKTLQSSVLCFICKKRCNVKMRRLVPGTVRTHAAEEPVGVGAGGEREGAP